MQFYFVFTLRVQFWNGCRLFAQKVLIYSPECLKFLESDFKSQTTADPSQGP
jgi:hypothetical protein